MKWTIIEVNRVIDGMRDKKSLKTMPLSTSATVLNIEITID